MNCGRCACWRRMHASMGSPPVTPAELAASTVHEMLNSQLVKLHKVRLSAAARSGLRGTRSRGLGSDAAAEMLRQIPEGDRPVAVLSYDQRSGVQAIGTTAPEHRNRSGMPRCSVITNPHGSARSRSRLCWFGEPLCASCHGPAAPLARFLRVPRSLARDQALPGSKPGRFELVFTPTAESGAKQPVIPMHSNLALRLSGRDILLKGRAIGVATHPGHQQGRTG
jgi:hypothetical protein